MAITPETLKRLAQFDTPTICNVIELFDVRPRTQGFMNASIKANFPEMPPMVGFASTAAFRSGAFPGKGDAYGSLEMQVAGFAELPGPAVVVFQDLDDPPVGATFGEVMCSTYKGFGSVGLITSGGGRDLLQVKAISYPVFTGSTICSHACCHILHVGMPVRVGGLVVDPGDLLHGDANGVTNIPHQYRRRRCRDRAGFRRRGKNRAGLREWQGQQDPGRPGRLAQRVFGLRRQADGAHQEQSATVGSTY